MLYQIEITTHCNFECFYCAGRTMPQKNMEWSLFRRILDGITPQPGEVVSLQGEGEPTIHPRFWDMAEAVTAHGLRPYTITNGSCPEPARFAALFPMLAVSIDTLDEHEAARIGRHKLERVLENLDALGEHMAPGRIIIMTVDYGQPLDKVRAFAEFRGYAHVVQPLQVKDDYSVRYAGLLNQPPRNYTYRCQYLELPLRRYYDIEGREYPCCYIKDASLHQPITALRASMQAREVPRACAGCREILQPGSIAKPRQIPIVPLPVR